MRRQLRGRHPLNRIRMTLARSTQATQAPAKTALRQLDVASIVQRHDLLGLLRVDREHQPAASLGQRQHGHRAFVTEALPRTVGVIAFGHHGGDEQGLPVVVVLGVDTERVADEGVGAIRAHHQRRVHAAIAVGGGDLRPPAIRQAFES